tara:strand:+ start:466 stop:1671 length:1206 start_codon:yes stop_codon:yes gene_type:complete
VFFLTVLLIENSVASTIESTRVFLDCNYCDENFIKKKIEFVDWVRDRKDANVHLLITRQRLGNGGRAFQLAFLTHTSIRSDTLKTELEPNISKHEQRSALVHMIKVGLIPFVAKTAQILDLNIGHVRKSKIEKAAIQKNDSWDSWVFEIDGQFTFNREEQQGRSSANLGLSGKRVTEDWRIRKRVYGDFEREEFKSNEKNLTSDSHTKGAWCMVVKSLGPHWSAGMSASHRSSTYDNIGRQIRLQPAVEFSYFDYAESDRRELLFIYSLGPRYTSYNDTTVYEKINDKHIRQRFEIRLDSVQPWGSVELDIESSQLLPDFEYYRLEMRGELSLRIVRGLSFDLNASLKRIKDQLNLPRGNVSTEDLLLRRRELQTNYLGRVSLGLSYTFGSMYNNVVNTRL